MSLYQPRTDLAVEARELLRERSPEEIPGAELSQGSISDIEYQILTVSTDEAAQRLGKPQGKYCTVEIDPVMRRDKDAFQNCVDALSKLLRSFFPHDSTDKPALLAGLGNRAITPDSVGPAVLESTLVTRHLKHSMPDDFAAFREVAAVSPGVLGTSGIESSDYIKCFAERVSPAFVIAIDALAARSLNRLCRTVQISDTGITPGSGVGNSRMALNEETIGVPVIAVGVPTVVDIRTVISDLGATCFVDDIAEANQMIVTPRNIDSDVSCISRLVGYALNVALHDGLTISDIDMLIG